MLMDAGFHEVSLSMTPWFSKTEGFLTGEIDVDPAVNVIPAM